MMSLQTELHLIRLCTDLAGTANIWITKGSTLATMEAGRYSSDLLKANINLVVVLEL